MFDFEEETLFGSVFGTMFEPVQLFVNDYWLYMLVVILVVDKMSFYNMNKNIAHRQLVTMELISDLNAFLKEDNEDE